MSLRELVSVLVLLLAGFLVVSTAVRPATAGLAWVIFGVACALTIISVHAAVYLSGTAQRLIAAAGALLGSWTIVAAVIIDPETVRWIGLGSAIAFVGLDLLSVTLARSHDRARPALA
jgi:hypothetical protein